MQLQCGGWRGIWYQLWDTLFVRAEGHPTRRSTMFGLLFLNVLTAWKTSTVLWCRSISQTMLMAQNVHSLSHCGLLRSCHRGNETVGQCLWSCCFSPMAWDIWSEPQRKVRMKVQRELADLACRPRFESRFICDPDYYFWYGTLLIRKINDKGWGYVQALDLWRLLEFLYRWNMRAI